MKLRPGQVSAPRHVPRLQAYDDAMIRPQQIWPLGSTTIFEMYHGYPSLFGALFGPGLRRGDERCRRRVTVTMGCQKNPRPTKATTGDGGGYRFILFWERCHFYTNACRRSRLTGSRYEGGKEAVFRSVSLSVHGDGQQRDKRCSVGQNRPRASVSAASAAHGSSPRLSAVRADSASGWSVPCRHARAAARPSLSPNDAP